MTQRHWEKAVNGAFGTPADWTGGVAPGPTDDAILNPAGAKFTVTVNTTTVHSIQTAANATLAITAGTFTATAGTGSGANAGTITLADGANLVVAGLVNDTGLIKMGSVSTDTQLLITGKTTLEGKGFLTLSDAADNIIEAQAPTDVLTNFDDVISGSGELGAGQLTLVNSAKGVIEATGSSHALILDTSGETVTNSGFIEGVGAAGLVIASTTVNDSTGGTLFAGNGSSVSLENVDIIGGTLRIADSGAIRTVPVNDGGSTLDGTKYRVTNAGVFEVEDGTTLTIEGSIVNTGQILVQAKTENTLLSIGANTALSGGGTITSTDSANNIIVGAASTDVLSNVGDTISGDFQLGDGQLTLINGAKGVIDATGSAAPMVIDTRGETVANSGLIEATGSAGLVIEGTTINDTSGGEIEAATGSTNVTLENADIIGGALKTLGTGVIQTVPVADGGSTIDGTKGSVALAGYLNIDDGTYLTIEGTIDNTGQILMGGAGDTTQLIVGAAGLTLTGAHNLLLNGGSGNQIVGAASNSVFTNVNNVISGGGQIFDGNVTFVNAAAGVVGADLTSALLITTPGHVMTNAGIFQATGTGGMVIENTTINGSGGLIYAGAGSSVTFTDSTVRGGAADDELRTAAKGLVTVGNNSAIDVLGTLANAGTIAIASTGADTGLRILAKGATLTGGGTVTMGGSKSRIYGISPTATLINVDNTISGAGYIGLESLTLNNEKGGVIDASGSGSLVVGTHGETLTNAGLLEGTSAVLALVDTSVDQSSGGVIQTATGGRIDLRDADIIGGTVKQTGSGAIATDAAGNVFDGSASAVTIDGEVVVLGATSLALAGSIVDTGSIQLDATTQNTDLIVESGGASLTGGGHVNLDDTAFNRIYGATAEATLTNVDDRIAGSGLLGDGTMTLVNEAAGIIVATSAVGLVIDAGTSTVVNAGHMGATGDGTLTVASAVDNSGTLLAGGGIVILDGVVSGEGSGVINGGTLDAASTFDQNVEFSGNGVLELAQAVTYTGTVTGFSTTGSTFLDLADIADSATTEVSYQDNGHHTGGVLTATDGARTAQIKMVGDYSSFRFTSDGHGGIRVSDPSALQPAALRRLVTAMAAFGASTGPAHREAETWTRDPQPTLAIPLAHAA